MNGVEDGYGRCTGNNGSEFAQNTAPIKLGIPKDKAWEWANTRKAYWRIAKSRIVSRALGNAKLKELGWVTFSEKYKQVGCKA